MHQGYFGFGGWFSIGWLVVQLPRQLLLMRSPAVVVFGQGKLISHGKDKHVHTHTHTEKDRARFPAGLALTLNNLANSKLNGLQLLFMWILRLKANPTPGGY